MDNEEPPIDSTPTVNRRRRYSRRFKEQILAECGQPGNSIAGVSIRHGLNPNLVHKWRNTLVTPAQRDFIPLPALIGPPGEATPTTVRIEVPTPKGTLVAHWPLAELSQSVTWLRALTR